MRSSPSCEKEITRNGSMLSATLRLASIIQAGIRPRMTRRTALTYDSRFFAQFAGGPRARIRKTAGERADDGILLVMRHAREHRQRQRARVVDLCIRTISI